MYAYFPPSKYDETVEKVWVKRMLPCVWIFEKRRRAKDYIRIDISLADHYKQILDLFKFEPKKKYSEELEDTGESNATSISDISDENNEDEEQAFETSITESFLESIDNIGNNVRPNPYPSSNVENPSISSTTSITSVKTAVTSVKSSATSVQSNETEQATCDLCQKKYTVRGITKHRNACLKKQQT